MKQSKLMSWVETCLNTAIGFGIAMATQVLVFPLFGYSPPLSTNFKIAIIFTVVSIVRGFVLRRVFEALHVRRPLSPFVQAVIAERFRQIEAEGWSQEHDESHALGELARAGAAYALWNSGYAKGSVRDQIWPWHLEWWKPTGFRRDLVKACALIMAEGEKFDGDRKRGRGR